MTFDFRGVWAAFKAQTSGEPTVKVYKNLATTGVTLTAPEVATLINTGYALSMQGLDASQEQCSCFQIEFLMATMDVEMVIYAMNYVLGLRGVSDR